MVEVNPTTVEVESTTLDVKLTVVEDNSVAEEFDSVAKELNSRAPEFYDDKSCFGRCGVDSTVSERHLQSEVYLDRITNKQYLVISELIGVVSSVLTFACQISLRLGLVCQDGQCDAPGF
jgi:hypothetical protein